MEKLTKTQKIISYIIIIILLIITFYLYFSTAPRSKNKIKHIYAGIGGAVKNPKVYNVDNIKYLYELILLAGGLTKNADISKIDTEKDIIPFAVYCIPYQKKKTKKVNFFTPVPQKSKIDLPPTQYEEINIIYAGLPRTFLFITLVPKANLIMVTHIPYYTLIPNSYYYSTLYETYLTGGISFLINSAERITNKKVDYYFAQNREQWIRFIDLLGGVKVELPDYFRKDYDIKEKNYTLDGVLSWEYIRYINKDFRKNEKIIGTFHRMDNQKEFIKSMFSILKKNNFFKQGETLNLLLKQADTNIKAQNMISIFFKFKDVRKIKLKLYTFPGTFRIINNKEVWVTQQDIIDKKIREILLKYGG